MENTYKQGDTVMFRWEECTYVGDYKEDWHLINWYTGWHDWKTTETKERAVDNWYTFVWYKYWYVDTLEKLV